MSLPRNSALEYPKELARSTISSDSILGEIITRRGQDRIQPTHNYAVAIAVKVTPPHPSVLAAARVCCLSNPRLFEDWKLVRDAHSFLAVYLESI